MNRFLIFRIVILLIFAVLVRQLYILQFREGATLAQSALANTFRDVYERPLRGEIYAADGETLLAESRPSYTIAILRSQLPEDDAERQQIFAWLDDVLQFQSTLVVTPAEQLSYEPRLKQELELLVGPFDTPPPSLTEAFTVTVPLSRSVEALQLTRQYTGTLLFHSPIEELLRRADLPAYETVPLTTTTNLDIGRIILENKSVPPGLPGVQVEQNYQRHYPKSAETPSLAHILGYIGSFSECDILTRNPPRFWPAYLVAKLRQPAQRAQILEACFLDEETLRKLEANPDTQLHYLLTDRIGRAGLERTYEEVLRGQLGITRVEVDVTERLVSEPQVTRPTLPGNNLILTIDYALQQRTEQILRKWIAEAERRRVTSPPPSRPGQPDKRAYYPIEAGVALVMEVKTGRMLAMVSWPAFDNNIFNRPITEAEAKAIFDPGYPKKPPAINQAIQGLYPPGSTWKQISAAAALAGGVIGPDTKLRDPGFLAVKNKYFENDPRFDQIFPNSVRRDNGWISVRQALQVSSNVFFQSVIGGTQYVRNLAEGEKIAGLDETAEKLADMAYAFGFGKPTGIPLPGELAGRVPSKSWKARQPGAFGQEAWTIGDTYNTAIGQGNLAVTPIQLLVASAAVANGGTLFQPQLVKEIRSPDGQLVDAIEPVVNGRVPVAPEHLQVIREGMRLSVTDGLNVCARDDISGLAIAGKTGTAEYNEVIDPNKPATEDNIRKRSHAWFVGFAPYADPEIEVLVLIEGAGDMNDGSATLAVPAVTEIMQAYYQVTPPIDPATPIPPYNLPCH